MVGPGTLQWTEHERPIDHFRGPSSTASAKALAATPRTSPEWYVGFYQNRPAARLGHGLDRRACTLRPMAGRLLQERRQDGGDRRAAHVLRGMRGAQHRTAQRD